MKPWTTLARTTTPDGNALTLSEHDGEYVLRVNGRELMSTRRHASELRLGELAGLVAASRPAARVLVGGLGLGFTVRGVLAHARPDTTIDVAELLPDVVAWNRNSAWPLAHDALADPRVRVVMGDVFATIAAAARAPEQRYDAIVLDADNGTTAMMNAGNRKLYVSDGIRRVRAALRPGGTAVYWSAAPEPQLETLMRRERLVVHHEIVRAWGSGGTRHWLIIGRRND